MSNIFSQIKVKGVNFSNRIVMAPMVHFGYKNKNGNMEEKLLNTYLNYADKGIGLIISQALLVTDKKERGDVLVHTAFALVGVAALGGASSTQVLGELILGAYPAYMIGRMLVERIGLVRAAEIMTCVWAVAAVLGLVEAVTGFNPFTAVPFPSHLYQVWAVSQKRAERSEERRVGKECRSRWSPYH